MGRRTRHNISSDFILSNHFEQKIRFFLQKKLLNAQAREQACVCVCMQAFLRIFWMATVVCRLRGWGRVGQIYRRGMHRQRDGDGGVQAAAVWHNKNGNERKRTETNGEKGVPRYTPMVGCAVGRYGSGGQIYRRGKQNYPNPKTNPAARLVRVSRRALE